MLINSSADIRNVGRSHSGDVYSLKWSRVQGISFGRLIRFIFSLLVVIILSFQASFVCEISRIIAVVNQSDKKCLMMSLSLSYKLMKRESKSFLNKDNWDCRSPRTMEAAEMTLLWESTCST